MERVVQIDYSFYGSTAAICSEKEAVRKVLVAVDTDTGMAYQIMCRTKGRQDQYVVAGICKFLTDLRSSDIVLQSDGEHPIRSIVAAIAQTAREKHGLVIRERRAPKFSHQSQGSVEATIRHCRGHFRTLRSALENGTGLEISMAHDIAPWLVRHAGWLISRFQPKAEKRSAYFRVHGLNTRVRWWSLVSMCCFGTIRQRLWRTKHGVLGAVECGLVAPMPQMKTSSGQRRV